MIETTLRATSKNCGRGWQGFFGRPRIRSGNVEVKKFSIAALPGGRLKIAASRDLAVVADGQDVARIVELGAQAGQPFVSASASGNAASAAISARPGRDRRAVLDGVAAVSSTGSGQGQARRGRAVPGSGLLTG